MEFLQQLQKIREDKNVIEEIKSTQVTEIQTPSLVGIEMPKNQLGVMCSALIIYTDKE